jgi:hypothetical protein
LHNPAVRVEAERSMPPQVGALIIDSLHREAIGRDMEIMVDAVQVIDGMLDRAVFSFAAPTAPLRSTARQALLANTSMCEAMRAGCVRPSSVGVV